jgi:hypothetical protein
MDKNARYPFKWFLLTPLSVFISMTLSTGMLHASPIDDERQPETSDPSAYYDEPADEPAALNAILTMPEANEDSFDLPNDESKALATPTRIENAASASAANQLQLPHQWQAQPVVRSPAIHSATVAVRRVRAGPDSTPPRQPSLLPFPPADPRPRPGAGSDQCCA